MFPGSLTLRNVKVAVWDFRAKWYTLGIELGLPGEKLQVIEGRTVFYSTLYEVLCILDMIYTVHDITNKVLFDTSVVRLFFHSTEYW